MLCIPMDVPVWIIELICDIFPSLIMLASAEEPIRISTAAHRPLPSFVLRSCSAITAFKDSDSMVRVCSCWSVGKAFIIRSMVFAALFVWRVPKTRIPSSAHVRARDIVSRSRISPTSIISGSSRLATLRASAKLLACVPISRWEKRHFLLGWTNSRGSSIVTICPSRLLFM